MKENLFLEWKVISQNNETEMLYKSQCHKQDTCGVSWIMESGLYL